MNSILIVILAIVSFYLFIRLLVAFWDKFFISKAEEFIDELIDENFNKSEKVDFGKSSKTDSMDNRKQTTKQKQNEITGQEFEPEGVDRVDENEEFMDDKKIVGVALADKIKGKHTKQFVDKFAQKLSGLDLNEVQNEGIHVAEEKARQREGGYGGQGRGRG